MKTAFETIVTSSIGAIVGFSLAQLVNLAMLAWHLWMRPKLAIGIDHPNLLTLDHRPDSKQELLYGFRVANVGQSIAENVRVFLASYELSNDGRNYRNGARSMQRLAWKDADAPDRFKAREVLVESALEVSLGVWREDEGVIRFSTIADPDYYEEGMAGVSHIRCGSWPSATGSSRAS